MSLLFGSGEQILPVEFSIPAGHSDGAVAVSQSVWEALSETVDLAPPEHDVDKLAVIIEPASGPYLNASLGLSSLVEWAILDDSVAGVRLPGRWKTEYPWLFPGDGDHTVIPTRTYRLQRITPVILSEVVLLARSSSALHLCRNEPERVKQWLCSSSKILRHRSSRSFDDPWPHSGNGTAEPMTWNANNPYEYEIAMTQPVLQGVADASRTSFVVTSTNYSSSDPPVPQYQAADVKAANSSATSPVIYPDECSSDMSDADGIEIGEGFLANSVPPLTASINGLNGNISPPEWAGESNDSLLGSDDIPIMNGDGTSYDSESDVGGSAAISLHPQSLETASSQRNVIGKGEDPEAFAYVSSSDLGRLGLFCGDWAFLSTPSVPSCRLARLIADDVIQSSSDRQSILASPLFLHNLVPEGSQNQLSIRPTPFGGRTPPLPTARSVTVARVSSPYSNNRMYQPLFLRALKDYFERKIRLLKMGDLIAVPIRAEDARLIDGFADEDDSENKAEGLRETLLNQEFPLALNTGTRVVFFKITNIAHDVATSIDVDESQNSAASDGYFATTMGELGCWIDSKVTQIIQTGLEHSKVPDVLGYLRIYDGFPSVPKDVPTAAHETPFGRLSDLVSAALLPTAVDYDLRLSVLLKGARGIGKQTTARWVSQKAGIHLLEVNCYDVVGESDMKTEGTLRARMDKAADCSPCILLLRHIEALAKSTQALETGKEPPMATVLQDCLNDLKQTWILTGHPVFVFATSAEPEKVPQGVLSCFKHEVIFEAPGEAERDRILRNLLLDVALAPDVSVKSLATQTAALVASDLVDLVRRARNTSMRRTLSYSPASSEVDCVRSGLVLTGADFETALGDARSSYSESIGAPKIPNVTWDDVGGLASVKKDILDTIQLPLDYPELFADGLKKRSGILLYGPPGTGKTLLAKAVATSCSLNFFSVKGPELLNMYIGESEANVRRVFRRARDAKPCVIFFDELDSVAPKRGNHGDSGGVMDRIVSQLLAELDGMADGSNGSGADVFVIGATNRPDLLDSALLRPGRFDRMLYLGVSDTHEAQLNILKALTRKFRLDPDLDLKDIAELCPFNYTGADFYALCSDAMLKSMSRKAQEIDKRIEELNALPPPYKHPHPLTPQYYLAEMATSEEIDVLVSRTDFELALKELVPSVSQGEMEHYREVQRKFASDTINTIKEVPEEEEDDGLEPSFPSHQPISQDSQTDASGLVMTAPQIYRDKGKGRAVD